MSVTKDLKFCESSFPAMLSNVFMLEPVLHLLHLLLGYKLSFFITCRFTWFTHQVETSLHVPRHLCTQGSRGSLHALFDSSPIILPQAELVLSPCHSGKKLPCHVGRGPKTAWVILRWISFGMSALNVSLQEIFTHIAHTPCVDASKEEIATSCSPPL